MSSQLNLLLEPENVKKVMDGLETLSQWFDNAESGCLVNSTWAAQAAHILRAAKEIIVAKA